MQRQKRMLQAFTSLLVWICLLPSEYSSKKSIAVGGLPFELRNGIRAERWNIYKEARKAIKKNNVPEMTLDEINAEINAARSGK